MLDSAIQGLLHHIAESPDEEDLYLILADRLEELADPRGELIRAQLEIDSHPIGTSERRSANKKRDRLLELHGKRWRDGGPASVDVAYRRGRLRVEGRITVLDSETGRKWLRRQREWLAELKFLSWNVRSFQRMAREGLFDFLNHLDLSGLRAADNSLFALEGLENLRNLFLSNTLVGNDGLQGLSHLPKLEGITLSETPISNVGMMLLSKCTGLRHLNLSSTRIGDPGLEYCRRLTRIRSLYLAHLPMTDVGLSNLAGMSELRELGLSGTDITNDGLAVLQNFRKLRFLDLSGTEVTAAGLAHLRGMDSIERLYLLHIPLRDECFDHLATLTGLRKLEVKSASLDYRGFTRLREALPHCDVRW